MMKTVFITLLILTITMVSGFGQKKRDKYEVKADTIRVDSLEYELIVLDPGFESWLATQPPKQFYSKEYYELKNKLDVSEWNHRYLTSNRTGLYDSYIDYSPTTDYGLDLNYKLYYFFRYFEETNKVKLYPSGR